ncbi:MAG: hypothetical protein GX799_01410 [Crenarchaeota archaeon]|nr:hypothetical protein [Thermoproteota archaeon]
MGIFSGIGFALEAVKGEHHLKYHMEVYSVNTIPERGNILFFFPNYDKEDLLK